MGDWYHVRFGAGIFVGWQAHTKLENLVVILNQAEIMGGGIYDERESGAVLDRVMSATPIQ